MKDQLHMAAQYLAAAGISFLDKKDDDSHTNAGFNTDNGCLETHPLSNNGDLLSLNFRDFSLEWTSNDGKISFNLDGATHEDVLKWLKETSKNQLNKEYHYDLHYDMPYKMEGAAVFRKDDESELAELTHLRILAEHSLEHIVEHYKLDTSIRVWPHHFDTGIYTGLNDSEITIGLGLAIPDTLSNDHYLYISGYKDGKLIETSSFNKLSKGEWKNDGFKGAILPVGDLKEEEWNIFFKEAIEQFKKS
ncbi:hypothetical protein [Nonlabens ulvanivorans]|uniref:hypothetical protein n=2 Tax=Nonlabens ulvanivorans TaxID=906888 RepID=UPI0032640B2E